MLLRRDLRKNKIFSRRALIIGSIKSSLILALTTRLSYLQIFKHQEYSIRSDSNSIKPIINPAPRGIIYDRSGIILAYNNNNYRLLLYLENKKNLEELINELCIILALPQKKELFLSKVKNARRRSIISLLDNLSWDDLAKIEVNSYRLPGISIGSGNIRHYPFPFETASFLGYVSLPSEKEIDENEQKLFMHPDFRVGKGGVEKSFDEILRGKYGVKYVEVNSLDVPIRTLSVKDPIEGSKLHLTIDIELQKFITARLKNEAAASVVMDVKTGEIISYVSMPSFDPNNFVEGISRQYWSQLFNDEAKPLSNKPISATYPPGSTFKLMVALAGLENGFDPKKKIICNGHFEYGKRIFHCWKEGGHGSVNMADAIMHSCNVYFFTLGSSLGIQKIAPLASRFGYGEKFDISLYGAKTGNIPTEEWKRKVFNQPWVGGDNLNTAIGQGFILATPLQMALITARIANGGVPIKPYLVKNHNIKTQYQDLSSQKLVKDSHLKVILEGMNLVVNKAGGSAFGSRITVKGLEMAGKTGTSQVISKRSSELSRHQSLINNIQNHAIFVGFAPVSAPKYAVSVVIEHGKSGSKAAAPVGRDILLKAQMINKIGEVT
jgi:penicillin-binding protein 2